MKILKMAMTGVFFLACAGVGAGATYELMKIWKAGRDSSTSVMTGTGSAPAWHGVKAVWGAGFEATVQAVAGAHGTAVAIAWPGDAEKLKEAVAAAHKAKLAAVVAPGGEFAMKDPYPVGLEAVAAAAQAAGAEALCVSWLNADPDEKYWREQIALVRKHYKGKVIFGVNGETMPDVGLWDAVDFAGVVGPVELPRRLAGASGEYTVDDARALWASKLDEWESIGIKSGKPLVLVDVSLGTGVGSTLPADKGSAEAVPAEIRELFYRAVLIETRGRVSTQGLLLAAGAEATPGILKAAAEQWGGQAPGAPAGPSVAAGGGGEAGAAQ